MSQATGLAQLLGLGGVEVDVVEREADGSWTAHVRTAPGRRACCPGCGRVAERAKERTAHSLKHLVLTPMRAIWHKARCWCDNDACATATFAEAGPVADAGAAVSAHAKTVIGHLVGDWLVPVSRAAAGAGVSWHTAHDAFAGVAAEAGIVVAHRQARTRARRTRPPTPSRRPVSSVRRPAPPRARAQALRPGPLSRAGRHAGCCRGWRRWASMSTGGVSPCITGIRSAGRG